MAWWWCWCLEHESIVKCVFHILNKRFFGEEAFLPLPICSLRSNTSEVTLFATIMILMNIPNKTGCLGSRLSIWIRKMNSIEMNDSFAYIFGAKYSRMWLIFTFSISDFHLIAESSEKKKLENQHDFCINHLTFRNVLKKWLRRDRFFENSKVVDISTQKIM